MGDVMAELAFVRTLVCICVATVYQSECHVTKDGSRLRFAVLWIVFAVVAFVQGLMRMAAA